MTEIFGVIEKISSASRLRYIAQEAKELYIKREMPIVYVEFIERLDEIKDIIEDVKSIRANDIDEVVSLVQKSDQTFVTLVIQYDENEENN